VPGGGTVAGADREAVGAAEERRYPYRQRNQPKRYRILVALGVTAQPERAVPASYSQAVDSKDAHLWRAAMDSEMESQRSNGSYSLVRLPPGVRPIHVRWVFDVKRDGRYKARLVAKGYEQRYGVNFRDTYAPASKFTSLRALLALAAPNPDMVLHQMDVSTAFLHGELEEDIYVQQPEGYVEGSDSMVWKLNKALYGLKQAPRVWWQRLGRELVSMGFEPVCADPTLYVRRGKTSNIYVLFHVDDIIVGGQLSEVEAVKADLKGAFSIKDLGELHLFLGMEVERDKAAGTISLTQKDYTAKVLDSFGMSKAKARPVPLGAQIQLTSGGGSSDRKPLGGGESSDRKPPELDRYSELVGELLYLANCTRPDIAQAVGALARYTAAPTKQHWEAAMGLLRYLAGTRDKGLLYGGRSGLEAYCDADYAGCLDTRRSTTGYAFILNGGAISWSSRLQPTVATSTQEAEYMAAAGAAREGLWLRKLLPELGMAVEAPLIWCDNQSCLALLENPRETPKAKHIDVIHHFVRERVQRKEIRFEYVGTEWNVADIFTKPLTAAKLELCREGLGVV
jgi:hypothetical protein